MIKKGFKEVNKNEKKELQIVLSKSRNNKVGNLNKLQFKLEIDLLLEEIPLKKVKRVKSLFRKWCDWSIKEKGQLEQIYRAFYSSYKTKNSYWNFKAASVILLNLYGYVSDEEIESIEKGDVNVEEIFEKRRKEVKVIKEIDDTLRSKTFWGHIPMNVSCLAIGASIAFTKAVKSILHVIQKLHEDKNYRKGHYVGGLLDWDEAILIRALPYHWFKKGGKAGRELDSG